MRKSYSTQLQLDCIAISDVQLNLNCRDEIIPILRGLQEVYKQPKLRQEILQLIASDVNANSRDDVGREGFDYWQILVMTIVRHGCNLNYDKLQDLCEQHRSLRHLLGIGDWDDKTSFHWRRIHDNITLVKPATIEIISHLIVACGHKLVPLAVEKMRADSFVVETNIHYPTESNLMADGLRKVIPVMQGLAHSLGLSGWQQSDYLLSQINSLNRTINRIASRKGKNNKKKLKKEYKKLLRIAKNVVQRIDEQAVFIIGKTMAGDPARLAYASVLLYVRRLRRVMSTAHRRIILGETVPNSEKIFSIYEPHTQLYRRGKAGQDVQFGRLLLVYEDAAGFIFLTVFFSRGPFEYHQVIIAITAINKNQPCWASSFDGSRCSRSQCRTRTKSSPAKSLAGSHAIVVARPRFSFGRKPGGTTKDCGSCLSPQARQEAGRYSRGNGR